MSFGANFESSPSLAQLRHQAEQGSVEAITQLLNQALAHKQIKALVWVNLPELHICLQAPDLPPEKTAVILCCREIGHWSMPMLSAVWISGQAGENSDISWRWKLALAGAEGHLPTVQQAAWGQLWTRLDCDPADLLSGDMSIHGALPLPRRIDQDGWTAVAVGTVFTGIGLAFPWVGLLLNPLLTLIHELGHTVTSWLFGYPAIPALDFIHGGGITLHTSQRFPILLGGVYAGFGYLFHRYWHNYLTARLLLMAVITYTVCAFSPMQDALILGMGHGFELIAAAIFLGRAISGDGCRYASERPLYGILGVYVTAYDLRFSWQLLVDQSQRALYEQGKGGLLDHDLVRLARDIFQVDLSIMAAILLLMVVLTPVITWIVHRYWLWLLGIVNRLSGTRVAR